MKKFLLLTICIFLLSFWAQTALAQKGFEIPIKPDLAPLTDIETDSTEDSLNVILQIIAGGLVYIAAPIAILMIAFYGLRLSASMSAQEDIDAAKKGLTWAIVGLLIILLSVVIVRFVISTVLSTDQAASVSTTQS